MINLTQHLASPEQLAEGVQDLPESHRALLVDTLTFHEPPTAEAMALRADLLVAMVVEQGATEAMIGGAPYFMPPLEAALLDAGIQVHYSFTRRMSVDQMLPDGSTRKLSVFRHAGWVVPVRS